MQNEPKPISDEYSQNLKSLIAKLLCKNPLNRPTVTEILGSSEFLNREEISSSFSLNSRKTRKPYQKEISINIPTISNASSKKEPISAQLSKPEIEPIDLSNVKTVTNANNKKEVDQSRPDICSTVHVTNKRFNFSQSLLKQLPNSPMRPMLMGDFLKRKLGEDVFDRVRRVLTNTKDPVKLLQEES